jgi:hypothetical protein
VQTGPRSCDRLAAAVAFQERIIHRKFAVVRGVFAGLRDRELAAVGTLSRGLRIDVPPEFWLATTVIVDTLVGGVACEPNRCSWAATSAPPRRGSIYRQSPKLGH